MKQDLTRRDDRRRNACELPRRSSLYLPPQLPVRLMHWINVVALTMLLMSGLQIFNAHPSLYWGKSSYTGAGRFWK